MTIEKQLETIFELTRQTVSSKIKKLEDNLALALEGVESLDEQLQSCRAKAEEQALEIEKLKAKAKAKAKLHKKARV